jgi:peptidoglycan/xylan/chitin deacetylase (PgdA/CDA1 family)
MLTTRSQYSNPCRSVDCSSELWPYFRPSRPPENDVRPRALLKSAFSLTGLIRARWHLLRPGLYCFNYHRVGNPAETEFDRNTFSCTSQGFEEHLDFLQDCFEVVNIDRLLGGCRGRPAGGRKAYALITFDDGYLDNYSVAFPVLRKHGLSAVFFLPTSFVGSSHVPWWDEIAWVLRSSAGTAIPLEGAAKPFVIDREDPDTGIRRVLSFVKSRATPLSHQVEEIRRACGQRDRPQLNDARQLFLNWDQARVMHSAGMDIGSHTHAHRVLAHLTVREQKAELGESKAILEAELRAPITSIAYPVGSHSAYTPETCGLAKDMGYRLGFNFRRRNNRLPLSQPLDIGRLAVNWNVAPRGLRSMICFPRVFRG